MITQNANLLSFLNDLRKAKIYYRLSQHRDDAIMVEVTVPGERWEVEFLEYGSIEAEVERLCAAASPNTRNTFIFIQYNLYIRPRVGDPTRHLLLANAGDDQGVELQPV